MRTHFDFASPSPCMIAGILLAFGVLMSEGRGAAVAPLAPTASPIVSASASPQTARIGLFPNTIGGLSFDHLLLLSIGAAYGALQLQRALPQPPPADSSDDGKDRFKTGNVSAPRPLGSEAPVQKQPTRRHS